MRNRQCLTWMYMAAAVLMTACLMLAAPSASAAPVLHKLTLVVTEVFEQPAPECATLLAPTFGCDNAVGDVHIGFFSVDSTLLGMEGDNLPAGVSNFVLSINDVVWDQANPDPASSFSGFRDTLGFAASFDVDVHGGSITDVIGGVYGGADVPFVDFSSGFVLSPVFGLSPTNSFYALDVVGVALGGTLQISRVPEPGTLFLISIGMVGMLLPALARRRRAFRRSPLLAAMRLM